MSAKLGRFSLQRCFSVYLKQHSLFELTSPIVGTKAATSVEYFPSNAFPSADPNMFLA